MKSSNPIIGYILAAVMFFIGMMALVSNYSAMFSDVESDIESHRSVVLSRDLPADSLKAMLISGGYLEDAADASFISRWITTQLSLKGEPENLGELNRPAYKIPAKQAYAEGGSWLKSRVKTDYEMLGLDADWFASRSSVTSSDFGTGVGLITVKVSNAPSIANAPLDGILVRLREHSVDSTTNKNGKVTHANHEIQTTTVGFAITDSNGEAQFHVDKGKSYSVVPIAEGYQYGREKGTTSTGKLGDSPLNLNFRQQEHVLTPFDTYTYRVLKSDNALLVRTPSQFKDGLIAGGAIFLVGWLALILFFMARDRRMGCRSDYTLLITIMVLTGLGLLAMFGMTNPLNDKSYGLVMAKALAIGLVAFGLTSSVNLAKFFNGKSLLQGGTIPFDPIAGAMSRKAHKSLERSGSFNIAPGITYLLIAVVLIILLGIFGTGPEGSDARVNLGGFQPSEICKYLILIFVAAFFAENATLIQAFSAKLTPLTARRQAATVSVAVAAMLGLMMLYLLVLSDMGPALVVLVTFIFIYSMARRDFAQLLLGLITFIALMLGARAINNTPLTLGIAAGIWFIGWIAFGWFTARRIYESALIVNLLIVVFALGAPILNLLGADSEAIRLSNRTAMAWGGQWDNLVPGSDQVAQGIWSAATGGFTGMGLGNGSPSLVPAFHTDMVFTSIGEMLGITGLILIILCFVILIHRSLLIGKRAAQPFTMYLVMGIALLTGVQFLFIVFGSLGIVPLTGVTVPFLSYSRTSLIACMAMFGFVAGASRVKATQSQLDYANSFAGAISASVILFLLGSFVIIGVLANYQIINRSETLIRPAYITNTMGARVIEYNPRIDQVLSRLHAGNIYDRNGLLLATSSADSLRAAFAPAVKLGVDIKDLRREANRRKSRYYTLGNHTLFMLGDAATRRVLGYMDADPIGFMAEQRYKGELRGIDIPLRDVSLSSGAYRENRFMPAVERQWKWKQRDYTNILPFLDDGIYNNPKIAEFNERREERDMYLTLDASLQKMLDDRLARYIKASPQLSGLDRLRASVVVLNASNGDLLSSANYPLPQQDSIVMLNEAGIHGDAPFERIKNHKPITERDLGMTYQTQPGSTAKVITALAALKALGPSAASITYNIRAVDEIEQSALLTGPMNMEKAIVNSSNNYFINILHDRNLYGALGQIYEAVGARVVNEKGENASTYFFNLNELNNSIAFNSILSDLSARGLHTYDYYIRNPKRSATIDRKLWGHYEMATSWGQGPLRATPLMMARVASIVANNGRLAPTRYVSRIGNNTFPHPDPVKIVEPEEAQLLKSFMQKESQKRGYLPNVPGNSNTIGGKTGTPERVDRRGNKHCNDAWYICFAYSRRLNAPVAIALRLERTVRLTSEVAKEAMGRCIIPALNDAGYNILQ